MNRKAIAILVTGSVIFASTLVTISMMTEGHNQLWLEDFEAFYDFIEENYPYLWVKNRTHGYNWLDLKVGYEARILKAVNESEILDVFLDAVCALQNRHTYIIDPQSYSVLQNNFAGRPSPICDVFSDAVINASLKLSPIYAESISRKYMHRFDAIIIYEKGEYAIINSGWWEDQCGENLKVIAVDGVPIDDAVKGCFEQDYVDWDFYRNKLYLWKISPRDFGADAIFTIRNSTGYENDITFKTLPYYSGSPYSYPGNIVDTKVWEEESTAYLHMSTFDWGIIEPRVNTIVNFFKEIEGYNYLIIDIRGNTGGNYASWIEGIVRPLITEEAIFQTYLAYRTDDYSDSFREVFDITDIVSKDDFDYLPPEVYSNEFQIYNYQHTFTPTGEVTFNGSIILLSDPVIYSAAEAFTLFCKQTGFASIYGTTSGGDGIMVFPIFFCLPNSKIVINLTSALGLDHTGHSSEEARTQPDVFYESAFGNHSELVQYVRAQLS